MIIARHIRVRGRVQGVFYRAWTQLQAAEIGVDGWVRNCGDGTVEAQLEGEEDAVLTLIERMRDGPSGADVEDIVIDIVEPECGAGFQVRH